MEILEDCVNAISDGFLNKMHKLQLILLKCKYFRFRLLEGPLHAFAILHALHWITLAARCLCMFWSSMDFLEEHQEFKKEMQIIHWIEAILTIIVTEGAVWFMTSKVFDTLDKGNKARIELISFTIIVLKAQNFYILFLPRPFQSSEEGSKVLGMIQTTLTTFELFNTFIVFLMTYCYYCKWCAPRDESHELDDYDYDSSVDDDVGEENDVDVDENDTRGL